MEVTVAPTWDGKTSSLDSFEERIKRYVRGTKKDERYLCAPRLLARFDPDGDLYRTIKAVITDEQLMKEDGSGVSTMITILRGALGPKSMQEAVRLLLGFLKLQDIRRCNGEGMKKWTTRWQLALRKVGAALNAACPDIPADKVLHPMIQCILLAETSGLSPSEFASVLGTSGKTGKEGSSIGNSWDVHDLATAFAEQWSDDAIALRDARSRRNEAVGAIMESYTFGDLGLLEAQVNGVEAEEVTEEVEDMPEAIYGAEDYGAEDFDDQYEEEGVDQIYGVSEYDAQDAENSMT